MYPYRSIGLQRFAGVLGLIAVQAEGKGKDERAQDHADGGGGVKLLHGITFISSSIRSRATLTEYPTVGSLLGLFEEA